MTLSCLACKKWRVLGSIPTGTTYAKYACVHDTVLWAKLHHRLACFSIKPNLHFPLEHALTKMSFTTCWGLRRWNWNHFILLIYRLVWIKEKKNKTPKADGFLKIVTFRNVFSNTYKQQQQKQHPLTYLRGFPPTKPRITIFALIYFLSYSSVISWSLCNKPCDISPLVADLGMQMRSGTEGGGIVPLNLSELIRNTIMPCSLIINHS